MKTSSAKRIAARHWRSILAAAIAIIAVNGEAARRGAAAQADVAAFLAGDSKDCPGCNLPGANLAGANLRGASFHRAVLRGANLSGADLTEANLNKTDLIQANLSDAKLSK